MTRKGKLWTLIIEFAKSNRWLMLAIPLRSLAEIATNFTVLLMSGELLEMISSSALKEELINYSLKRLFIIFVLQVLMQIMARYIEANKRFLLEIQNNAINEKSMKMDYEKLDDTGIQRLRTRQEEFTNMTGGLYKMLIDILDKGIKNIASVIFALYIVFQKDVGNSWMETNGSVLILILFSLLAIWFNGKMLSKINIATKKYMEQCMEGNRFLIYYLYHILFGCQNAKDLRIYNQKPLILQGIQDANSIFQAAGKRYAKEKRKKRYAAQLVSILPGGLVYLLTGINAYKGVLGIGGVIKIAGGIVYFINGMSELGELYSDMKLLSSYSKDYIDYLDIDEKKGELPVKVFDGGEYVFEFDNVSFCYPHTDKYIIQNLNLTLRHGEKIAIVGKNGSGKTTLLKLLCRLYDVTEGEIKLNGTNIREIDYAQYNAILTAVFQDFSLFSLKIGENIATKEEYNEKELQKVLERSGLMNWINQTRYGLNSFIGKDFDEDGIELSGGERQKVAIARAVYKRAPVVIMDEPTAALDPVSECEVYEQFNDIVDYKIAIYISHRLASCRFCDRIIVLDSGKVVQEGKHEALVLREGLYRDMWNAQAKHYKTGSC